MSKKNNQPELFVTVSQLTDQDRSTIAEIYNSRVIWLSLEKNIPEQWGNDLENEQDWEFIDSGIAKGLKIVKMALPGSLLGSESEASPSPVAIYRTGPRPPYIPGDPDLPEELEEDLSNELYLSTLTVHVKYKGYNLGERIIELAKQEARDLGKEYLRLDCFQGVERNGVFEDSIVQYYVRNGFTRVRPFTAWIKKLNRDWSGI